MSHPSRLAAFFFFAGLRAASQAGHEVHTEFKSGLTKEVSHEVRADFKSGLTKEVVPEETKINIVTLQSDYVGQSKLRGSRNKGEQDVSYQSAEYGHRFLISGNWYFRTGLSYERYDFGGTKAPVPGRLQSFRVPLAIEYVQNDYVGATVQIEPGFFYENEVRANTFDIPWEAYSMFKLHGDKVYGVLGASGAQYYSVPVVPIIGVVWIMDEAKKFRLEAIFPHPALVYNASEDWEFRVMGEIKGGGYRTDRNDRTLPAKLNNAVLEYYEYRVGAQVTFSHFKPFDLVLNAGYALHREFNYYRADKSFETAPAPYVRLELDAEF